MKKTINLSIRVVIALIYLYGGFIFFTVNYRDHQKVETLKASGMQATAIVKEVRHTGDGPCPYAEFTTAANEKASVLGETSSSYNVGDEVSVKYNPQDVEQAAIESDLNNYHFQFSKSVFGSAVFCAICFSVAIFTLFSKRFTFQLK